MSRMGCTIYAEVVIDYDAVISDCDYINAGAIVSSMSIVPAETKIDYGVVFRESIEWAKKSRILMK